jgi:hypothetical protein
MKFKNRIQWTLLMTLAASMVACTTTETVATREASARPRIEQRALSNAIDIAFRDVNFGPVIGKKVFIETQSLSRIDVPYINGYIAGIVLEKGGQLVQAQGDADVKIYNVIKTSGTDEIKRKILSDRVRGEYKSILSFIDVKTQAVIRTYEISGVSDENR